MSQRTIITVPGMYADHHVLRVRAALLDVIGVTEVKASAGQRRVAVEHKEAVSSEALREALEAAGYGAGDVASIPDYPARHADGSAWHRLAERRTQTEQKDLEMSGDYRRY